MTTKKPEHRTTAAVIGKEVQEEEARASARVVQPISTAKRKGKPTAQAALSDAVLLQRVAAGNRLAMHALYARYNVRLHRFALRLVGNAAAAEDVTSEVFLDVWRQAGKFEGRSTVSTWLFAIARFKSLSMLRRAPAAEIDEAAAEAIEDPADDPHATLEKKDRGAVIRQCLTLLSAEHRVIIDLVYYHEKSIQEVAVIVGIPVNTVKTRMFYARRKLAELLAIEGLTGI